MSEALQARALEPARCTPARGCLQSVRAMHSHTDANRRMQTHASTCESSACCFRRAKTSSRVPIASAGAHCQSIFFAMRVPDVLSAKSGVRVKQREARQMLENWRRRDFQNFASENKARCKLRESTAEPRPMPEGVTASVAPDREQRVKAPGSEDRRLETAAGERGHDRLKRSRR